jgi:hypothetical protein
MALRRILVRAVFLGGCAASVAGALAGVGCGGSTAATATREAGTDATDSMDKRLAGRSS